MRVLLVGCGHLGQALLRRWVEKLPGFETVIVKPSPLSKEFSRNSRLAWHASLPNGLPPFDAIIYAVRPVQLPTVLPSYASLATHCVNISLAAGWPTKALSRYLGDVAIVRTMPNVPAQIGQGMTPLFANEVCDAKACKLAEDLFNAVGETLWLQDESLIDVATALSGSGPAYIYLLTAAMALVGTKLGLDRSDADRLAMATVRGAANYMAQSGESAENLYRAMQLPGGTTEAALKRLLAEDGMVALLERAMRDAANQAKAIGAEAG